MANKKEHVGDNITVLYDVKRCIHAAECVRGLPQVFDVKRKPWIDPNAATPDAIAAVVMKCPSGALQFERRDGGEPEPVPATNTVKPIANGPLNVQGKLEILTPNGEVVISDTRMTLCRCGASKNKPFCDNSHAKVGFKDGGALGADVTKTSESPDKEKALKITPSNHGPLVIRGPVEVVGADGKNRYQCDRAFLCRCGASKNKPFCDGTHKQIGFTDTFA
ncbi:MAG: hypothetical protein HC808_17720 [Candidatus Competibacteraceae bacterium]|nr:hypothetical protein [Candidatus Competibacteraceae bacterium]